MSDNEQRQLDQILDEFRSFRDSEFRVFRDAITTWQLSMSERMTKIESEVKAGITGNGSPSRLASVEEQVKGLQDKKGWTIGFLAGVSVVTSTVIGLVAWIVPMVVKIVSK